MGNICVSADDKTGIGFQQNIANMDEALINSHLLTGHTSIFYHDLADRNDYIMRQIVF